MPCGCDLLPTFERIHGKATPELKLRLELADKAGKDDEGFEDHMQLEEKYIFQALKPEVRKEFGQTHKEFRSYRINKISIPEAKFQAHALREKQEFLKIGFRRF